MKKIVSCLALLLLSVVGTAQISEKDSVKIHSKANELKDREDNDADSLKILFVTEHMAYRCKTNRIRAEQGEQAHAECEHDHILDFFAYALAEKSGEIGNCKMRYRLTNLFFHLNAEPIFDEFIDVNVLSSFSASDGQLNLFLDSLKREDFRMYQPEIGLNVTSYVFRWKEKLILAHASDNIIGYDERRKPEIPQAVRTGLEDYYHRGLLPNKPPRRAEKADSRALSEPHPLADTVLPSKHLDVDTLEIRKIISHPPYCHKADRSRSRKPKKEIDRTEHDFLSECLGNAMFERKIYVRRPDADYRLTKLRVCTNAQDRAFGEMYVNILSPFSPQGKRLKRFVGRLKNEAYIAFDPATVTASAGYMFWRKNKFVIVTVPVDWHFCPRKTDDKFVELAKEAVDLHEKGLSVMETDDDR